jgi:alkylhydroperoxidase family enzyme
MAWIRIVSQGEASPELLEVYDEIKDPGGRLSPALQVVSLNPKALRTLNKLNRAVTFGASRLGRRREEILSVVVSRRNGCHY